MTMRNIRFLNLSEKDPVQRFSSPTLEVRTFCENCNGPLIPPQIYRPWYQCGFCGSEDWFGTPGAEMKWFSPKDKMVWVVKDTLAFLGTPYGLSPENALLNCVGFLKKGTRLSLESSTKDNLGSWYEGPYKHESWTLLHVPSPIPSIESVLYCYVLSEHLEPTDEKLYTVVRERAVANE